MPVQRSMRSRAVQVGMVGTLSLTLVACSSSTSADCVDARSRGVSGYRVVPDNYCDSGGSFGRYFWYYGGRRSGVFVAGGSSIRPRGATIKSRSGKTLSRGGFGGRIHGGS
ncbi:MAG TPA: hypothetical protein VH912_32525 [Streptosporangiaceae bacterium]